MNNDYKSWKTLKIKVTLILEKIDTIKTFY